MANVVIRVTRFAKICSEYRLVLHLAIFGLSNANMNNLFFIFKKWIAATLCAGCIFFISCENDMGEVQNLSKKTIGVEEGVKIESFMSQSGKMKAKLTAPL